MTRAAVILLAVMTARGAVHADDRAAAAFEQLKALAGEWEAPRPGGRVVRVTYELVSGGTAVLETLRPPDEPTMMSVYHVDGDAIAMTHYCSIGNQPRMQAGVRPTGRIDRLSFSFVDAGNLSSPAAGHMHALVLTFDGPDRLVHEWSWQEGGKATPSVFAFVRRK
jgi:hypothetical protein